MGSGDRTPRRAGGPASRSGAPGGAVFLAGGAIVLGLTPVLYELSGTSPSTGAFYRCVWALPALAALAALERRRTAVRDRRGRIRAGGPPSPSAGPCTGPGGVAAGTWLIPSVASGAMLGLDLLMWHRSIRDIGSGLATAILASQVIFAALLARWLLGERVGRGTYLATPLVLLGAALAADAFAPNPSARTTQGGLLALGAAIAYAAYVVLAGIAVRRSGLLAAPMLVSTATTAAVALCIGSATGSVDLAPSLSAQAWLALLALDSQVVGWLLVSRALSTLPVASVAASLTLQTASAMVFGAVLLSEYPRTYQLAGCALLLFGVAIAARARMPRAGRAGPRRPPTRMPLTRVPPAATARRPALAGDEIE